MSESKNIGIYDYLSLILFATLCVVVCSTVADYGVTWDEWYRWEGGKEKLAYYENLFSGKEAVASTGNTSDAYPGLFDLSLAILIKVLPFDPIVIGHSFSAFFGVMGIFGSWKIGNVLGGARLAFYCSLFLVLVPRYYGHMFFNPKDIPFACCYLWAVYYIIRLIPELPKPSWAVVVKLGIAVGFATACRIGGLILFGYIGSFMGLFLLIRLYETRRLDKEMIEHVFRFGGLGLVMVFVAYSVLLPFWPFAHSDPFGSTLYALKTVSKYPWNGFVLFEGQFYRALDLPWYYILKWILITVPQFYFVVFLAGVALAVSLIFKMRSELKGYLNIVLQIFALVYVGFFPIFYVIYKDSILYDGMRHLLFSIPPLICLVALSFVGLERLLSERRQLYGYLAKVVVGIPLCLTAFVMVNLHPYQYTYFNGVVGGLPGAYGVYDTDYWTSSGKEAVEALKAHTEALGYESSKVFEIHVTDPPWTTALYFGDNFQLQADLEKADYSISNTRFNHDFLSKGEIIHQVGRFGVPFAVVKDERRAAVTAGDFQSGD